MESSLSYEFDYEDNEIYKSLELNDLIEFLETTGYVNRKIKTGYLCYEHYKQIFQYSLIKFYNINSVYKTDLYKDLYYRYNSIMIDLNINIEEISQYLIHIFSNTTENVCFFIDIRNKDSFRNVHTTLLIYRPLTKSLEHFDSSGVSSYGYIELFNEIIQNILTNIEGCIFIPSKTLCSLDEYTDELANVRSLNFICGYVRTPNFHGWCQIWSLFMYEMIFKYSNLSSIEIIKIIYSYLKGNRIKDAGYIANSIIRGYYRIILGRTNLFLNHHSLWINSEVLKDFDPSYVLTDRKLIDVIEIEFQSRITTQI